MNPVHQDDLALWLEIETLEGHRFGEWIEDLSVNNKEATEDIHLRESSIVVDGETVLNVCERIRDVHVEMRLLKMRDVSLSDEVVEVLVLIQKSNLE